MKTRNGALMVLLLGLACAKDPMLAVDAAFKSGDLTQAEALLDQALAKKPDLIAARMDRLVLYRQLLVNGDAGRQKELMNKVIDDFDAVAERFGLKKDYSNIEDVLKSDPKAAALYESAHKAVYRE